MPVIMDPLRGRTRPQADRSDTEIVAALGDPADWTVLTGAGLSTDSGIPDYRGPDSPPRRPMTVQMFLSGPESRRRYWARGWIGWERMGSVRPNAGHLSLALLGVHGIVTQNVDGLHEQAAEAVAADGAEVADAAARTEIVDLHGRLDRVLCLSCGKVYSRERVQQELTRLNPDFLADLEVDPGDIETAPDGDAVLEATAGFRVWDCPACGGILKPDVVYFGESVPKERNIAAARLVDEAHGVLVLGTSLAVMSGLRLVRKAAKDGKPVVVVTDGPTRGDDLATMRSVSRVADVLALWEESRRA
ncbi:Sir2 family NAD-dependent protein deacetylase [Brevibacterium litoralis]|uniref:Sir2 family NAD-dependent protein deacetylase n=1 Tax=Brevibacterium litoralis TaxID=3138935 RepID=UPI0032ED06A3